MTDRRRRRAAPSDTAPREENPFAAPPEGRPDQPWQPRSPKSGASGGPQGPGNDRPGGTEGEDGTEGGGNSSGTEGSEEGDENNGQPSWGSRWSSRQPGRQSGGFGGSGGDEGGGAGDGGRGRGPGGDPYGQGPGGQDPGQGPQDGPGMRGLRWDPTDPEQRRARYCLHTGIWALFFAFFSLPQVALLLGALSLYWGISSLRGTAGGEKGRRKERDKQGDKGRGKDGARTGARATAADVAGTDRQAAPAPDSPSTPRIPVSVSPEQAAKTKTTAAVSGLIAAALALVVVAGTFAFHAVYRDYFNCTQDALTQSSRQDCRHLMPKQFRPFIQQDQQQQR